MRFSLKVFVSLLIVAKTFLLKPIQQVNGSPQSRRGKFRGYKKYDEKAYQDQISERQSSNTYMSNSSTKRFAMHYWKESVAFEGGAFIGHKFAEKVILHYRVAVH